MRVFKKQNGTILFKAPVGVMNDAFAGGQANFVKSLPAVFAYIIAVPFDLEHIEAF